MEKFSFLFPGQGTQFIQMGKHFYDNYDIAKETYKEATEVAGIDVADLCFNSSISDLHEFTNLQLAILTTEVAIFRSYMEDHGVAPEFSIGHSVGEYAALVSAGAIDFKDAVKIMMKRGELVSKIVDKNIGHMAIVENTNEEIIRKCIEEAEATDTVYISCYNSKSQYAISGANNSLEAVHQKLLNYEAIVSPLFNSPPIHSPLMKDICMEFLDYINKFDFYDFRFPVIANYTGLPFSDPKKIPTYLTYHLINPVLFSSAIDVFYRYGVTNAIEMSPKVLLSGFIKENQPSIKTYCYGLFNEKDKLDKLLESDPNFKKDVPNFTGRCLSILVTTENKNEDQKEFKEVVKIYEQIKTKYNHWKKNNQSPSRQELSETIDLLITALKMKKLDRRQIKNRIKSLLDETNTYYKLEEKMNTL